MKRSIPAWIAVCLLTCALHAEPAAVVIDTPMPPPAWALMERELLDANSRAAEAFAGKYLDSKGYLLHYPRWGTLDGPDDAIETFHTWTLFHALGGSRSVLDLFKKALEGHYRQYKELRTVATDLAKDGAYHNEFVTKSDWVHTGEGIRGFLYQGLSDWNDPQFQRRIKRFAGLYIGEDPAAPNYDPEHKILRSIWTGSKGPMLRRATEADWVGDPGQGRFHMLHSAGRRHEMLDLEEHYPKMLKHCTEYLDSAGDHPLNLGSTSLALHAYALHHEAKYRDWVIEYVDAWKQRAIANGGNIPTNIGLDGTIGGEHGGRWYKGTYGWNFTIFDGELGEIGHRNNFEAGSWPGFSNALLLTGDQSYVDVLRQQMANLYEHKKVIDGKLMIPRMFGDPRGYKYTGQEEWYNWTPRLYTDRLFQIYYWSMDRADLENLPIEGWLAYLEGKDPAYPEKALSRDFERLRGKLQEMRDDPTTPDTRLADWAMTINPVGTDTLLNLTLGGINGGRIWGGLHSRVRYFDPVQRRAGLPADVASLVERMTADETTLSLVNVNQVEPRVVVVQMGAYGEHQCETVTVNGETVAVDNPYLTVRLEPGSGARLVFRIERYANQPALAAPWDRAAMLTP